MKNILHFKIVSGLTNFISDYPRQTITSIDMIDFFKKAYVPIRVIIWIMCFTCTFFLYTLRINVSIIILAMVEPTTKNNSGIGCQLAQTNNTNCSGTTATTDLRADVPDYGTRYAWNNNLQGFILGSHAWGYFISNIPGGLLAEKFGPTICITVSFLLSAILTIAAPWAADLDPWALMVARFLTGLCGGMVFPCLHSLIAHWVPPNEKGKFMAALFGGLLSTVVTWPLLETIIKHFGWRWAFLGPSFVVILWTILWSYFVTDFPEQHRYISQKEKNYIVQSLSEHVTTVKRFFPYKKVLTSIPFWALAILHYGNCWGLSFILMVGPKFMSSVLGFPLGHVGVFASLPTLLRLIMGIIFGQLGDVIIKRNLMNRTRIRKTFILTSHILPGVFLFILTLIGSDVTWTITLLTLSLGINGSSTLTNLQNAQDLSPNFAGTLFGIINCIGNTTGFIAPIIVGYITSERNRLEEWHQIFYIGSSMYIVAGLFFCIFGSADIQHWNRVVAINKATNSVEIEMKKTTEHA